MSAVGAFARPVILFAHGAGAPSSSPWMQRWAERLGTVGDVETFDYPYMAAGRRSPDRMPKLLAAHRAALDGALGRFGGERPVFLAGKSMGSRIGCHLSVDRAREGRPPAGIICFGYPLRAGRNGVLRDMVLRQLTVPIAFLQGSRDPLCPLEDLDKVRKSLTVPTELCIVEGGDHSLELRRRSFAEGERTQAQWDQTVLETVRGFVARVLGQDDSQRMEAAPGSGSAG